MNMRSPARGALLLAMLALSSAASAQTRAAAAPCLTVAEGEAVLLFLAPDLLAQANRTCAPVLPAGAYLRRSSGLAQGYMAASDQAWPAARTAIAKVAGRDVAPLLDSAFARPAVSSLVAPLVAAEIKPGDCPRLDRILSLVAPLPPKNVAGIAVAFLQLANDRDRQAGRRSPLPICEGAAR